MAKFCAECGALLEEGKKFCANCGANTEWQDPARPGLNDAERPEQPVHSARPAQQPPPQHTQQAPPPYRQPIDHAPEKKKSVLPVVLAVLGAVVLLIVVTVVFIISSVVGILNKSANEDYYTVGEDRIPSVRLALGEERKITGISTTTEDGATVKVMEYKVSGTEQNQEMFDYYTYLSEEDGFLRLDDIDFSGARGTGVVARNSVEDGYEIQLQMEYDPSGYTITIVKQPGWVEPAETSGDEGG